MIKCGWSWILVLGVIAFGSVPVAGAACLGERAAPRSYSVMLIPRLSATALYRDWAPFLERLGRASGMCFDLRIPDGFPEFERALRAGDPDFVFMNPYHQLTVARDPGYIPLLRDQQSGLAGIVVVRKESPVQDIRELDGKTVAFPAPNAYVASLLVRALFAQNNIHVNADYVGSHNNVYRAVALGMAQAGGGANTTLSHEPPELRARLRVLYTTPFYMPHPFSAHPRVAQTVRDAVTTQFLNMTADPAGRELLKAIQIAQPTRADYARDYRELETLGLERFVVSGAE